MRNVAEKNQLTLCVLRLTSSEETCEPLDDAFVLAARALFTAGRASVNARRIHASPQHSEHAVRNEAPPLDRIEVQRLLIDLNLRLES